MPSLADAVRETFRRDPLLAWVAAINLVLAVVLLPLSLADPLQILGLSRWTKPLKFATSIAIFTATMAWILSYLRAASPRTVRAVSVVVAAAMLGEIALIVLQAARGVRSHFNTRTVLDETVFAAMGLLIILNTTAVAVAGWLLWRRPVAASGAHLTGLRLGVLLFLLGSLEGGLMIARGAHAVGVADGGPGLPFVNWSTTGGDLRVAHFVGMHALQALPLLGWWLDRRGVSSGRLIVATAAVVWITATAVMVARALSGVPLLALTG